MYVIVMLTPLNDMGLVCAGSTIMYETNVDTLCLYSSSLTLSLLESVLSVLANEWDCFVPHIRGKAMVIVVRHEPSM